MLGATSAALADPLAKHVVEGLAGNGRLDDLDA
jgi:hypothetical protein